MVGIRKKEVPVITTFFYFKKWEFLGSHLTRDVRPYEESNGMVKNAKKIFFPLAPGPDRAFIEK